MAVLAGLVLAAPSAMAQGVQVGLKGGFNASTLTFKNADWPTSSRKSGTGGVFLVVPIFGRYSVQPEVLYSPKGAVFEGAAFPTEIEIDYLEAPVLVRVPVIGGAGARIYALAGPSFAYRLRARTRTTFSGATEAIDAAEDIERLDFGILAGAGMELGRFLVEGRYTYGLSDIDTEKDDRSRVTVHNRTLNVLVGIRF
jgi:hypothetical protein